MKSIAIGEFKAKCLALLEQVKVKQERLLITKRGKPIAAVIPLKKEKRHPMKNLRGTVLLEKDIVAPLAEDWDAER